MMRQMAWMTIAAAPLMLAGCHKQGAPATGAPVPHGERAVAMLHDAAGMEVGRATATEVAGGLRVTLDVHGLSAGTHGAHVHTTGLCEAPAFASAGPHWNPLGAKHGTMNPQGPHEGDMPNLIVAPGGHGTLGVVLTGATMAGLLDADGAAIVVHEKADDLMTDPSGNSGGRIACGVFAAT